MLKGLHIANYERINLLFNHLTDRKNEKYVDIPLKMEATSSSEAVVSTYQVTWRQVPESVNVVVTAVRTSNLI
jgi:hypothetical protein